MNLLDRIDKGNAVVVPRIKHLIRHTLCLKFVKELLTDILLKFI
uniref:Uncharacterized protein n=1 Tax=Lepeophtheirus salmonis TaxID=72036 RepID=A0A0K2V982_LEPSM